MKRLKIGIGVHRTVILGILSGGLVFLGILAGGLGTSYLFLTENVNQWGVEQRDWLGEDLFDVPCGWSYLKVDENGWSATSIKNLLQLTELINTNDKEIVIPIFPTVYTPNNTDDLYYNTVLESDIEHGDKVLVIGAGSGSDAWVAWLKSQSLVYVIEINPMGIANINTTARIGDFQVKPILGDITEVNLPEDFSNFDFVLWNMPYLWPHEESGMLANRNFHDGDDGSILRSFLRLLPSLLKKDGQAIILNTVHALEFIKFPNLTTKGKGNVLVYIFSNDAD